MQKRILPIQNFKDHTVQKMLLFAFSWNFKWSVGGVQKEDSYAHIDGSKQDYPTTSY